MALPTLPTLIYCAAGNREFLPVALKNGFKHGAQLPRKKLYAPLFFADQDFKKPDREKYMKSLETHNPVMATVIDWEKEEQFNDVISWAEEASQYCDRVLIIPKVIGGIKRIPRRVNGKDIVLAFSVPTKYGATNVPPWEFSGWPVHLLGGSPHQQIQLYMQMPYCDVVSVDGNGFQRKATKYCEHWEYPGRWVPDGKKEESGGPLRAFTRSVENISTAWRELV